MSNFGIPPRYWRRILAVFAPYRSKLDRVVVYGSRARSDHREYSDVDICVYPYPSKLSRLERADLATIWSEVDIPYNVDLVFFDELANPDLQASILRDGVKLELNC